MFAFRRHLARCLFAACLPLALAACGGGVSTSTAQVRFIQASPNAPMGLTLTWHGNWILTDFTFQEDSGYFQPADINMKMNAVDGISGDKILEFDARFENETDYTIVFINPVDDFQALILVDDLSPAPEGQFKLRFLHMAPSASDVDIYIVPPGFTLDNTVALAAGIQYSGGTSYFTPNEGNYQIVVTEAGTTNVLKQLTPLTFNAGQIRTVVLFDSLGGGAPYSLKIMTDQN